MTNFSGCSALASTRRRIARCRRRVRAMRRGVSREPAARSSSANLERRDVQLGFREPAARSSSANLERRDVQLGFRRRLQRLRPGSEFRPAPGRRHVDQTIVTCGKVKAVCKNPSCPVLLYICLSLEN